MAKRILALLIVCLMLLPVLVACGDAKTPTDTTGGDVDPSKYIDKIPAGTNYNKANINILYAKSNVMPEYDVEYSDDMKPVEAALYSKNNKVQSRLGVKLNYIPVGQEEMIDAIEAEARTQSGAYDILAGYSRKIALATMKGFGVNLKNYPIFSFENPYWSQDLMKSCTIGNGLYYASGDISTNLLYMMNLTFFNNKLIRAYRLENPYDLVKANQWTQEKMFSMCAGQYEDLDGNKKQSLGDKFGYVTYNLNIDALFYGAGMTIIDVNNGVPTINQDYLGEKCRDWIVLCVDNFKKTQDCYYSGEAHEVRGVFGSGNAIFLIDSPFCVDQTLNNYEDCDDYGIVPVPKWDSTQENYRSGMRYTYSHYTLFAGSPNLERAATVMEAMASENYVTVTPEIFETTMKYQYALEDTGSQMFDIIRDNIVYDFARDFTDNFTVQSAQTYRSKITSANTDWISYIGRLKGSIQSGIDTIVTNYQKNYKK